MLDNDEISHTSHTMQTIRDLASEVVDSQPCDPENGTSHAPPDPKEAVEIRSRRNKQMAIFGPWETKKGSTLPCRRGRDQEIMADEHWAGLRHATWNTNCLSWLTPTLEEEMRRRTGLCLEYEVPGGTFGQGFNVYKELVAFPKTRARVNAVPESRSDT